jgi:hypothetical protein
MITNSILYLLALQRNLEAKPFDMKDAMENGKGVILWHTTDGTNYCGYRLHVSDVTGGNVSFTRVPELNPHKKMPKGLSVFYFVECDGFIASCFKVWPGDAEYWLGDMELDRYRINLTIEAKVIPNDTTGTV